MTDQDPRTRRLLDTFLEKEINRRRLIGASLRLGLGGLVAAQLPGALLGCPAPDDDDANGDDDVAGDDATVVLAGGSDPVSAAAAALALAGGLAFLDAGQSVFLKLAANQGDAYPFSTHPDVLVWIVEQLRAAGAGEISCGDSPFWGDHSNVFGENGLQAAADSAQIPLHDFRDTTDWVSIPVSDTPDWPEGVRMPAVMLEADHIINLPVLKTHFIAGTTLALKLQIGATHPDDRQLALGSHARIDWQIAQINLPLTPSLTITDGFEAVINGGPAPIYQGTEIAELGLAMVSADRLAHDVVGTAVLRHYTSEAGLLDLATPWDLGHLAEARAAGLAIAQPGEVTVAFEGIDPALREAVEADLG
jgi:uncharacterized protein (DUF362 family)